MSGRKAASWTPLLLELGLCLLAGYVLAGSMAGHVIFNADSAAPFQQASLIASGAELDPSRLNFARIPSLFPDLASLIALAGLDPAAGFHLVLPRYGWLQAALLLFLVAEFCRLALVDRLSRPQAALLSGGVCLGLVALLPPLREVIGLGLTPLHHGGNSVMTLLLGCLVLQQVQRGLTRLSPAIWLLTLVTVLTGVLSNRLFAFTALLPSGVALLLVGLAARPASWSCLWRRCSVTALLALALLLAALLYWPLDQALNTQCTNPLLWGPIGNYQRLPELFTAQPLYLLISASAMVLALVLLLRLALQSGGRTSEQQGPAPERRQALTLAVALWFLLASLASPFLYLLLLAGEPDLPLRYLLITPLSLLWLAVLLVGAVGLALGSRLRMVRLAPGWMVTWLPLGLLYVVVLLPPLGVIVSRGGLTAVSLRQYRERAQPLLASARELRRHNLRYGVADFWGSEIALAADLFFPGGPRIGIEPMLNRGTPDLWAHSKTQFTLGRNGPVKPYAFAISSNPDFLSDVTRVYGPPSQRIRIDDRYGLLIFRDPAVQRRMRQLIGAKLASWQRYCGPTEDSSRLR